MAQEMSATEHATSSVGDVAERARRTGTEVWQRAPEGTGALVTLLVGAALGVAAYAFLTRASGRHERMGHGYEGVVSTLNKLIAISRDGEYGFRTSAEAIDDPEIKQAFEQAAQRCAQGASELEQRVRMLGGHTETGGSTAGAAHRGWVNLKSAISGRDKVAILNEVERGEDVAKAAYEKALAAHLPPDIRALIERQYHGVRQNHDRVRSFRNAARQAAAG